MIRNLPHEVEDIDEQLAHPVRLVKAVIQKVTAALRKVHVVLLHRRGQEINHLRSIWSEFVQCEHQHRHHQRN